MSRKLILPFAFTFFLLMLFQDVFTNRAGAPAARSGGAGESSCAITCHTGSAVNSGPGTFTIGCNAPGNFYVPGDTYTFTVSMVQSTVVRFGFEVLCGYSSTAASCTGSFLSTDAARTQKKMSGARWYVTHTTTGSAGTDSANWTFKWIAPVAGTGAVQFFGAGNGANDSNNSAGDKIYTTSLTLNEQLVSTAPNLEAPEVSIAGSGTTEPFLVLKHIPSGSIHLEVMNVTGTRIHETEFNADGSENHLPLAIENQQSGIYFAILKSASFTKTIKFVKL